MVVVSTSGTRYTTYANAASTARSKTVQVRLETRIGVGWTVTSGPGFGEVSFVIFTAFSLLSALFDGANPRRPDLTRRPGPEQAHVAGSTAFFGPVNSACRVCGMIAGAPGMVILRPRNASAMRISIRDKASEFHGAAAQIDSRV